MLKAYLTFFEHYPLYLGVFITIIPLVILARKWGQLHIAFRFLFLYLLWKLFSDLLMVHMASLGKNNIFFYNLTAILRYTLLSGMIYHIYETPAFKKLLLVVSAAFLPFSIWDNYYSNLKIPTFNDLLPTKYALVIECILMILWILLFFYEIIHSLRIRNLLRSPLFLTAAGWLLFYASLVFFAPLIYYIYRWDEPLHLGIIYMIPDLVEMLTIVVMIFAAGFIRPGRRLNHVS